MSVLMLVTLAFQLLLACQNSIAFGDKPPRHDKIVRENAENVCRKKLGLGYFETEDGRYCCNCAEGEYLQNVCLENHMLKPDSRICKKCPFDENDPDGQMWMDVENNSTSCKRSIRGNHCSHFLNAHRQAGTRTKDAGCVCNEGFHLANQTATTVEGGCQRDSPCPAGFQPFAAANGRHDTLCEACPERHYSNYSSLTDPCILWTECVKGEYVVSEGNGTHDRICEMTKTEPETNVTEASSAMTTSAIVGIVVGAVLLIPVIVGAVVLFRSCHRNKNDSTHRPWKYKGCRRIPSACNQEEGNHVTYTGAGVTNSRETNHSTEVENESNCEQSKVDSAGRQSEVECAKNALTNDCALATAPLNKGDSAGGQSEVEVQCAENVMTKNCERPSASLDKENFKDRFANFEKELNDAEKKGCRNCCLQKHLENHEVGKKMLESLEDQNTESVTQFLRRLGLPNQREQDLHDENRWNIQRYRRKIIEEVIHLHSRKLTPNYILDNVDPNGLREKMLSTFFENLGPYH